MGVDVVEALDQIVARHTARINAALVVDGLEYPLVCLGVLIVKLGGVFLALALGEHTLGHALQKGLGRYISVRAKGRHHKADIALGVIYAVAVEIVVGVGDIIDKFAAGGAGGAYSVELLAGAGQDYVQDTYILLYGLSVAVFGYQLAGGIAYKGKAAGGAQIHTDAQILIVDQARLLILG